MSSTGSRFALQAFNVLVPVLSLPLVLHAVGVDGFAITGTIALFAYIINTALDFGFSRFGVGQFASKSTSEREVFLRSFVSLQLILGAGAILLAVPSFFILDTTSAGILLIATTLACLQIFVNPALQHLVDVSWKIWFVTIFGRAASLAILSSTLFVDWPEASAPWFAAVTWLVVPIVLPAITNCCSIINTGYKVDFAGARSVFRMHWFSALVHMCYSGYSAAPALYAYFFLSPQAVGGYLFAERIRNVFQGITYPLLLGLRTVVDGDEKVDSRPRAIVPRRVIYISIACGTCAGMVILFTLDSSSFESTQLEPAALAICLGLLACFSLINYFSWTGAREAKVYARSVLFSAKIVGLGLVGSAVAAWSFGLWGALLMTVLIEFLLCFVHGKSRKA